MNSFFLFVCFIIMWLMIFGVCLYYTGLVKEKNRIHTLYYTITSLFLTMILWLIAGYSLAFHDNGIVIGDLDWSIFNLGNFIESEEQSLDIFQMLFQMSFCMYAVVMLNGAIVERVNLKSFLLFLPLWILVVYIPLVYWIWSDSGWLMELGVLDFSGGMVVHISAGVSSLVLAKILGKRHIENLPKAPNNIILVFLGTIFICFGWFGFNAGPVGEVNALTGMILVNTVVAIICGACGWTVTEYAKSGQLSLMGLLNGTIVGLVGSTSGVAYVSPVAMMMITFTAGIVCCFVVMFIQNKTNIDDAVDSFGMNAIGGIVGSLGTGFFATTAMNSDGADGLINGGVTLMGKQILGIIISISLSALGTYLIAKLISAISPLRTTKKEEDIGLDYAIYGEEAVKKN